MNLSLTLRHRAGVSIGGGLVVGALVGAVEFLVFYGQLSRQGLEELLYALGIWAAAGAFSGLGLAVVWAILSAAGIGRERPPLAVAAAFHIAFFLFLVIGFRLNYWPGMPSPASPKGLLINGLLFVAFVALGVGLGRLLSRVRSNSWEKASDGFLRAAPLLIAIPFLLLISWAGFWAVLGMKGRARPPSGPAGSGTRPNVVLLVVDALRADHVSGYGYDRRTSLALDHLMDESVTFVNAFSESNWTIPSVASLVTGVAPSTHRTLSSADRLPEELTTLAEVLEGAGYACGAFLANAIMDIGGGFEQGFQHRYPAPKPFWCFRLRTGIERIWLRVRRRAYFEGTAVLGEAERWIGKNRDRPFFAYVHLMEPHSPYTPPSPYNTVFDPDYDGPPVSMPPLELADVDEGFWDWESMQPGSAALPERVRQNMVALYDGEIAYVDSLIERFLKRLRAMGLYDDTLILLTADHGEEFYDHGGWFHGQSLYDELVRVPLVVKLPRQASAGTRREEPVSGMDVLPSVLSVLNLAIPPGVQGADVLAAPDLEKGRPIYPERPPFLYSVRQGRWKLVKKETELKLFDLEADPRELTNVAGRFPEDRERLDALLTARIASLAEGAYEPETVDVDAEDREKLKALGYIQ